MMKKHILATYILPLFSITILAQVPNIPNQYHQGIVNGCSQTSINTNLQEYVNFGVKSDGSTEIANTLNWLKGKYQSYGYTNDKIVEDNYNYNYGNTIINTSNLVITKQGITHPNTYIIIGGHYDSLNGPGANDNGSGTVLLLEIAKQLANIPTAYSIKFIHFSGEERGLRGSNHYATNVMEANNLDVKFMLNIDQVGGVAGEINNSITCERDERTNIPGNNAESAVITSQLAALIELYSTLNTQIAHAYSSDYISFENKGKVITGLYESNETDKAHSPNDIIANMDLNYLYEVIQGATGATAFFAGANQALSIKEFNLTTTTTISPNPVKQFINLNFNSKIKVQNITIHSISGKKIYNKEYKKIVDNIQIPADNLTNGVYLVSIETGNNTITKKIIKQ